MSFQKAFVHSVNSVFSPCDPPFCTLGLSAGHISKVIVGDNKHQHFVVIGRAVDEVRLAQNLAKAGEIILSPNCWELCHRKLIAVDKIPDERAVKVSMCRTGAVVRHGLS